MKHLIIDGMLNGTGIRDARDGGYLNIDDLNLTPTLISRIQCWLEQYGEEHYNGYDNQSMIDKLDQEGIGIAVSIKELFPDYVIEYYSDARLEKIPF